MQAGERQNNVALFLGAVVYGLTIASHCRETNSNAVSPGLSLSSRVISENFAKQI